MSLRSCLLGLLAAAPLCWPAACAADDLYQPESYRAWASDVKAVRAGDLLTVLVTENASATTSADTTTDRATNASAQISTTSRSRKLEGTESHDFSGRGKTQRAGRLLAQLTVKVTGVLPNGDLLIAGEQQLDINDEKQLIRLEGRVRRQDVGDGNTVASSRIADARINYIGDGVLTDGQRVGLITRVLTWLGL
ncbi:MAG: flagellar basal body L-ring protein FlgH [Aquabacterium sp.]|jgi:flagellar L-ring protein precursor FlgH|nr:MAG: flagellar basal body L-ring protein FlgH [Aquabacterium sp.]